MRPRHYLLQEVHSQSARSFIEDSLFVDKPSDYLTEYGFQDKDRIIAINGLPYKQWIEQNEKYTEASTVPTDGSVQPMMRSVVMQTP